MQELFATVDIRKTFASTKDIPCASFLNDQDDACDLTAITMPCKYIPIRLLDELEVVSYGASTYVYTA